MASDLDNLVVVLDVDGTMIDNVTPEVERRIPRLFKKHMYLHGAAHRVISFIGEITVGKKRMEEKITAGGKHEIEAGILAVKNVLENGAKVAYFTINSMTDQMSEVLGEAMTKCGIKMSRPFPVINGCETLLKKAMSIKRLQEEEMKRNKHVVVVDDSMAFYLLLRIVSLGTKREERPDGLLMKGDRVTQRFLGYKTVGYAPNSINLELKNVADRIRREASKESPKSRVA